MSQYWSHLTDRERWLLIGAGVLTAVLALHFLIVGPVMRSHAERSAAIGPAAQTLDAVLVAQGAGGIERVGAGGPVITPEQMQTQVVAMATQSGISVSRVQRTRVGEVIIQVDRAAPADLFRWVMEVERALGVSTQTASLSANGDNNVRARVSFRAGAGAGGN